MFSKKIVVVEAGKDSSSLYTAHCAVRYGKGIYAVPSNINSKFSEGTNILISEGIKAYLSINTIIKDNNSRHMKTMDKSYRRGNT